MSSIESCSRCRLVIIDGSRTARLTALALDVLESTFSHAKQDATHSRTHQVAFRGTLWHTARRGGGVVGRIVVGGARSALVGVAVVDGGRLSERVAAARLLPGHRVDAANQPLANPAAARPRTLFPVVGLPLKTRPGVA